MSAPGAGAGLLLLSDDTASLLLEGVLVLGDPLHQRVLSRPLLDVVLDLFGALGHLEGKDRKVAALRPWEMFISGGNPWIYILSDSPSHQA